MFFQLNAVQFDKNAPVLYVICLLYTSSGDCGDTGNKYKNDFVRAVGQRLTARFWGGIIIYRKKFIEQRSRQCC